MCKRRVQIIVLKILKRSKLSLEDSVCFYKRVVEYGYVVWHHNLTSAQRDPLEALRKQALRIILHPITLPYNTALAYGEIEPPSSTKLEIHTYCIAVRGLSHCHTKHLVKFGRAILIKQSSICICWRKNFEIDQHSTKLEVRVWQYLSFRSPQQ